MIVGQTKFKEMGKMKKMMSACLAMAVGMGVALAAGDGCKDYRPYPHVFVGVDGGAQVSFTNYDFGKLITKDVGMQVGAFFTPVLGARLHVSGLWNRGGLPSLDETYDFNTVAGTADLLLNVTNMFRDDKDKPFNFIVFGGVGMAGAWDNDDFHALAERAPEKYPFAWDDKRLSHNLKLGVQLDFNIARHFGMNMELAANNRSDRINSKTSGKDDWSATAAVGLVFKFGHKKAARSAEETGAALPEQWATRMDTVWYDDVTYKDVPEQVAYEENIYYKIRMSEPEPAAKVAAIAKFVREHKNCKVAVTAYADKGTGTPELNLQYSKQRAEKVVAALVEAGVPKGIITSDYKGDTVQPFAENDKNRVAIVKVTGEGVKKEEVKTKKFKVEETVYRVQ